MFINLVLLRQLYSFVSHLLLHTKAKIASVDVTDEGNAELVASEQIAGYPTLVVYKSGYRLADYHGERTDKSVLLSASLNELYLHIYIYIFNG